MHIQKCKNCGNQFKWKDIVKSIWRGYKPIKCDNCKTIHYMKSSSRSIIALMCFMISVFVIKYFFYKEPLFIYIFLISICYSLLVCLAPFFTKYDIEDKKIK
ncbi:hypothetical protein SH2C18_34790 [Clostridium sediminicola]|uniref:TIGR04104 family putative zinc finger protein n=1 Tax=Clostridium sediminicola TaxID=3114879 RepID=UPI0031F27588